MKTNTKAKPTAQQLPPSKQYIGISRDHSGSMFLLTKAATNDYNENINAIQEGSEANCIDTIVSVVRCGVGCYGKIERETVNSNVQVLKSITDYKADGSSTPLFDSVGELIELLSAAPDGNEKHVSFLVMAITDGEDNSSKKYSGLTLGKKIRDLQATDHWTFVFRVPVGYANQLARLGIPAGNIQEWEQTARGMERATKATRAAFTNYYNNVARGVRSTSTFYVDMSHVSAKEVKRECKDITDEVTFWLVKQASEIRTFVESKLRRPLMLGTAFYQLTKTEKAVQDYKLICIRNRKTGAVYGGAEAREMIGLPAFGTVKVAPGDFADFDIFIQSTSTNRRLLPNTELLYWPNPS